jgi:hypothetical protein
LLSCCQCRVCAGWVAFLRQHPASGVHCKRGRWGSCQVRSRHACGDIQGHGSSFICWLRWSGYLLQLHRRPPAVYALSTVLPASATWVCLVWRMPGRCGNFHSWGNDSTVAAYAAAVPPPFLTLHVYLVQKCAADADVAQQVYHSQPLHDDYIKALTVCFCRWHC